MSALSCVRRLYLDMREASRLAAARNAELDALEALMLAEAEARTRAADLERVRERRERLHAHAHTHHTAHVKNA